MPEDSGTPNDADTGAIGQQDDGAPNFDGEFDAERAKRLVANLRNEVQQLKQQRTKPDPAPVVKPTDTPDPRYAELETRLNAAEKRDAERAAKELRGRVAEESGVPADLLIGDDEASLKAYAEQLTKWATDQAANPLRGRPRARLVPGTGGQDSDGGFDPAKIAAAAHRG